MSKYIVLILINLPLLLAVLIRTTADYKTRRITKNKYIVTTIVWVFVIAALCLIEPFYNILLRSGLTDSPSMSIFDVALLTLLVFAGYLLMRAKQDISELETRVSKLHERIVIVDEEKNRL